jgi:hypothetical protein
MAHPDGDNSLATFLPSATVAALLALQGDIDFLQRQADADHDDIQHLVQSLSRNLRDLRTMTFEDHENPMTAAIAELNNERSNFNEALRILRLERVEHQDRHRLAVLTLERTHAEAIRQLDSSPVPGLQSDTQSDISDNADQPALASSSDDADQPALVSSDDDSDDASSTSSDLGAAHYAALDSIADAIQADNDYVQRLHLGFLTRLLVRVRQVLRATVPILQAGLDDPLFMQSLARIITYTTLQDALTTEQFRRCQ